MSRVQIPHVILTAVYHRSFREGISSFVLSNSPWCLACLRSELRCVGPTPAWCMDDITVLNCTWRNMLKMLVSNACQCVRRARRRRAGDIGAVAVSIKDTNGLTTRRW